MASSQELVQNTTHDSSMGEKVAPNQSVYKEEEELPLFKYSLLDFSTQEMRFLVLEPGHPDSLVRCSFSFESLPRCVPYTFASNTRGNPLAWLGILIDGHVKPVTKNIVEFLGHIRSRALPQRLWFRDVCLNHQDPEEKSRCWNEEWMDIMIQHAEKVIDLSEVMAELWDKGDLPRPFPPTPKEWTNTRETKGTKHHPAPLQMQQGSGWIDSPPPHRYLPLDYVMDEFRLISLWKADRYDAPLMASLAYSVMHDDVSYHGLSYTWGSSDEKATCPILLNGQMFMIRKNLGQGLRELRHNVHKVIIWIDAICIDQHNVSERNRQIPRMLEIYDAAFVVISWLSEGEEASDIAIDFLDELQHPKLQPDETGNWGPYTVKEGDSWKIKPIPDLTRRLAALYRFFLRPYFRRIWVIQELAVATSPSVYCGKKRAAWSQLDNAAYHLIDILHSSRKMQAQIMAADASLESISDRNISFVRRLFYFRHLRSRNADHWWSGSHWLNIKDSSPGILDLMVLGRDFESTSPHDKIFALLNLAQDIDGIDFKPDYSKTLSRTYQEFAATVAVKTGSLDIICAAEPFTRVGLDVPSWCPDWSTPSTVSSLIRREHIPNVFMSAVHDISGPIYQAFGSSHLTPRFSFNGPMIEVAGIVLDTVKVVQRQEGQTPGECITEWLSTVCNECLAEEETEPLELNVSFMEKFFSMLAGDVTGVWSVEPVPRLELPEEQNLKPVSFRPICIREDQCKHRLQNISADVFSIVTRGRALIVTENGLMGLGPHCVEVGQKLAILNKCSAPVLLQENEDGTNEFKGSAFVQGWMEGEVLKELGLDTEEAWEVLDEGGRLKIV
ncbi:hypothetical protein EG329_011683 [Mollisiaceae sp. DMI_Dod_QoI]|nr:hypothetical protein EG329_011683 [Helotiales sp. DMI_Dod_QoI]